MPETDSPTVLGAVVYKLQPNPNPAPGTPFDTWNQTNNIDPKGQIKGMTLKILSDKTGATEDFQTDAEGYVVSGGQRLSFSALQSRAEVTALQWSEIGHKFGPQLTNKQRKRR
jgi:hypothetical protein